MAYLDQTTLVYDPAKLRALADFIYDKISKIEEKEEAIFQIIKKMGEPDHWSGESYDQMANNCQDFREKNMAQEINRFKKIAKWADDSADATEGATTAAVRKVDDNTSINGGSMAA